MKLVIISVGDKTFSMPVDSVQLLNKEIEKAPLKIKFEGVVVPVLQHPFIGQADLDNAQKKSDQTIISLQSTQKESEETIAVLQSQIETLQQKMENIKSNISNLSTILDSN